MYHSADKRVKSLFKFMEKKVEFFKWKNERNYGGIHTSKKASIWMDVHENDIEIGLKTDGKNLSFKEIAIYLNSKGLLNTPLYKGYQLNIMPAPRKKDGVHVTLKIPITNWDVLSDENLRDDLIIIYTILVLKFKGLVKPRKLREYNKTKGN